MHCKDIRKSILEKSLKEDLSFRGAFLEGAFTVPGDGCIDYKPLFDVLKEKKLLRMASSRGRTRSFKSKSS